MVSRQAVVGAQAAGSQPPEGAELTAGRAQQGAEDSDNFDDFAAVRGEQRQPAFPDFDDDDEEEDDIAARLGWGADESRDKERKSFSKHYLVAGAGAVVILVVVALIMLLQSDPQELTTTPRVPPPADGGAAPAQPTGRIDLAEPDIQGDKVVLTWTSNPDKLDFGVVVTRGTELGKVTFVPDSNHTLTVRIDASSPYCFQVQGSNSDAHDEVYVSQARSIRGSLCHH